MKKKAQSTLSVLKNAGIALLLVTAIGVVIFVSSTFFSRPFPSLGIVISSVLTCALTFPLARVVFALCAPLYAKEAAHKRTLDAEKDKKIRDLEAQNKEHEAAELTYEKKIQLLENLSFNMPTYNDVLTMCLRNYSQMSTIKQREKFNEADYSNVIKKLVGASSKNYDEVLSIIDCLVTYQRGIDLKTVRIAKINDDTVVISGITPVYITKPHFEYKDFFSEVRHVSLDKSGGVKHTSVEDDYDSMLILEQRQAEYKAHFEESFLNGHQEDGDSKDIIRRAQDFFKIILQPIYKNVQFSHDELANPQALPLLEYLTSETDFYKSKMAAIAGRQNS